MKRACLEILQKNAITQGNVSKFSFHCTQYKCGISLYHLYFIIFLSAKDSLKDVAIRLQLKIEKTLCPNSILSMMFGRQLLMAIRFETVLINSCINQMPNKDGERVLEKLNLNKINLPQLDQVINLIQEREIRNRKYTLKRFQKKSQINLNLKPSSILIVEYILEERLPLEKQGFFTVRQQLKSPVMLKSIQA